MSVSKLDDEISVLELTEVLDKVVSILELGKLYKNERERERERRVARIAQDRGERR